MTYRENYHHNQQACQERYTKRLSLSRTYSQFTDAHVPCGDCIRNWGASDSNNCILGRCLDSRKEELQSNKRIAGRSSIQAAHYCVSTIAQRERGINKSNDKEKQGNGEVDEIGELFHLFLTWEVGNTIRVKTSGQGYLCCLVERIFIQTKTFFKILMSILDKNDPRVERSRINCARCITHHERTNHLKQRPERSSEALRDWISMRPHEPTYVTGSGVKGRKAIPAQVSNS